MPHSLPFTTLDVFTSTPYIGNPLAIVRIPSSLRSTITESQKQKIAREFNLSETVFLHEPDISNSNGADGDRKGGANEDGVLDFDIFTPLARVSFAGHPTIGTAIYLSTHPSYSSIRTLRTVAGSIPLSYNTSTKRATVQIPHDVHTHAATLPHPNAKDAVPIVSIVKGMAFGLAQMADLDALGGVSGPLLPSKDRFKAEFLDRGSGWDVGYTGSFYFVDLGVEGEDGDVRVLRTRSYPAHEDPGTGSASGALCCYLVMRDEKKGESGTRRFHLVQGVEMGRRCDIWVDVDFEGGEDGDGVRVREVRLGGEAVEVMEGVLSVGEE